MPDAYARFSKQTEGYGASYNLSLGSEPGVATVTAPLDFGRINAVDHLDFYWQGRRFLRLLDARIEKSSSPGSTTSAPVVEWTIQDRRWKWQYGEQLDGDYNVVQEDGKLLREKTCRDIFALILDALGESNYDLSAVPAEPRPRITWDAANPKDELDRLCRVFGCAPAFNPFANKAYIVKLGKGSAPPNRAHTSRSNAFTNKPRPDAIRLIGGETQFQSALALEAVGEEVEGQYVPIDELSYKPSVGWGISEPKSFVGLDSRYTDPATGKQLYHRELAERSVFRCYRVKGQAAGGFSPDSLKGTDQEPKSLKDIGPLTGALLQRDLFTGKPLPVFVRGKFAYDRYGCKHTSSIVNYSGTFQVNNEQMIVRFDEPVFNYVSDSEVTATKVIEPASLELIAAYTVATDGVPVRFTHVRRSQHKTYGAGEHRIYHDEIVQEIIEKTAAWNGVKSDNVKEITKQAKHYVDAIADQFDTRDSASITYPGLIDHVCDGILRSVSWSFSTASAPSTSVAWDCETNPYIQAWEDRPEARQQKIAEANLRRALAAARRGESRARAWLGSAFGFFGR